MKLPVVLGFDLSELSFRKFGHKALLDKQWPLRRERIVLYQLAMLIGLAAECTATYSLAKYEDLQEHIERDFPGTHLFQNDIVDAAILTIVFCVLVATLFGADFFFLAQFPKRRYPTWYHLAKKILSLTVLLGMTAATLVSTIFVATRTAKLSAPDATVAAEAIELYFRPPLVYNQWAVNIAWVTLLWISWLFVLASAVVMWVASVRDERYGPEPVEKTGMVEKVRQLTEVASRRLSVSSSSAPVREPTSTQATGDNKHLFEENGKMA